MTPDSELLRQFAKTNSEDAFAELVKRHVNLVYSAALRQVNGDEHLAKDVAQTVFTDLVRKAGSLSRRENLSGWLYTSAHFAAAKIVRGENRRRDREEKFMREPTSETAPDADWEKLRPTLDDAMHELKESDREAVLLRYFENRQFAEVGAKLGLNENAARMRVERALEKLRDVFTKRGITTATALASVISANAIQIAPANLAATLTTASIATAGTGTFTLLKIMTATKLKLAFSAIVIAGAAAAFVIQQQTQNKLRAENESLQQQIAQLQTDNENFSNQLANTGDSKKLSDDQFNELLKLRGEVTQLRRRQIVSQTISSEVTQSETNDPKMQPIEIHLKARFISVPMAILQNIGIQWMPNSMHGMMTLLNETKFKEIHEALKGASDVTVLGEPEIITSNGMQSQMSMTKAVQLPNMTWTNIGETLDVTPFFSTNSSSFNLSLGAKLIQLNHYIWTTQTTELTNHLTLLPGQTVVLEDAIPPGWLPDSTNYQAGQSLLVFVTPQVVDSNFMKPVNQQSSSPKPPPPNQ